ncbi:hypothetical protein [Pararhizobium sp.]|uniref:hypothetical protein n=1 Tax=Pararhizobium sp. TaxID=1977563 RepID=UPI003D111630
MSARLLGSAFCADMGTCARKLILLKLVDACEDDGTRIFPAVATVARAAQCSTRQVQRELKSFVAAGLLIPVRIGGRGKGSTNEYALNLDVLETISRIGWDAFLAGDKPDPQAAKGDTMSPYEEGAKGDTSDTVRVTSETLKGDSRSHTTPPDPSIDPSTGAQARAGAGEDSPEGEGSQTDSAVLGVLTTDQHKRLVLAWSHWDGKLGGSENYLVRCAVELTPQEFERAVDRDRIDAYRHVEQAQKLSRLKLYGAYLRERKFDADAVEEHLARLQARPKPGDWLPAYGKAWMAWRLHLLTTLERREWRGTATQMRWYQDGKHNLVGDARHKGEFPAVFREYRPRPEEIPPYEHFVQICAGSDAFQAWADWHAARDWPWINPPEHIEFIWVPSTLPPEGDYEPPKPSNEYAKETA